MAEPEIKISVTASTGDAAAALKAFADQQASIQQRLVASQLNLTSATNAYRDAVKQLVPAGYAANDLNQQSLKILTEYKVAVDSAKASVQEQTLALKNLTPPMAEATEQTTLFAFAQDEAAASSRHLTTDLYAAQGASRLLSGNVPVRAFERFLTVIPGVGAALGAAFNVIGAIALIEVIGKGVEKIHEMRKAAEQAAENIDRAFREMADSLRASNDELLTRTAHLQAELDRAYKKPSANGAVEAFDEAAAAADRLGVSLDRDLEKIEQLTSAQNKKDSIGFWASLFSGKAETGDTSAFLKKQVDAIRTVNDEYSGLVNRAAESGNKANLASAQQDQLVALQKAYNTATNAIVDDLKKVEDKQYDFKEGGWGEDQTAKINLLRGALNQLALEQKNIGEQFANQQLQGKVTAATKIPKENYGDELAAQQIAQGKSLGETVLYWQQVVEKTGKYHEQLERAEEAFQKNLGEKSKFRAALKKDDLKEEPKTVAESDNPEQKLSDYYDKTSEAYARYHEEITRGNEILAQNAAQIQLAKIAFDEQSGAISKVTADHERGAVQARLYSEKIDELSTRLKQLQASIPQATAEGKLPEAEAEIQSLKNQIAQLQGQQQVGGIQNQAKNAQDLAAPYIKATNDINDAWLGMQNKLIFGTCNVEQAFANMGVQMLESVAASFEKMLVRQLQYEIVSREQDRLTKQMKTLTTAQAEAQGQAIKEEANIKDKFRDAGGAARGAWNSVVHALPFPVNFIVAPVAAAGAFTAVMAYEKGGIIPNTGFALVHEGEGVMPKNLTNLLTSVANNYQSSTASSIINAPSHFNGITDRNFREMARRHSDVIVEAAQKAARSGKFKIS